MGMVFVCLPSPNVVWRSIYPLVGTLSPEKPYIGSLWGVRSAKGICSLLKVFQYKISTKLPWSTSTFLTAKFSTSIVMTMGSSWLGSVPWKSESEKVMGGILLIVLPATACTDWTALRCLFLDEDDLPPPANPLDMVLIVPCKGGLSSVRLGCCWAGARCSVCWVLAGSLLGSLCSVRLFVRRSTRLLSFLSYRGL